MSIEPDLLKLAEDSSWESWTLKSDLSRVADRRQRALQTHVVTSFVVVLALCIPLAFIGGVPDRILHLFLQSGSTAAQEEQSLPQLSASSSLVIEGRSTSQHTVRWHGSDYTVTGIEITGLIKGRDDQIEISVRQLGTVENQSGRSGSQSEDVAPLLRNGKEYILYLNSEPAGRSLYRGEYLVSSPQAIWARIGHSARFKNLLQDITVPEYLTVGEARSAATHS